MTKLRFFLLPAMLLLAAGLVFGAGQADTEGSPGSGGSANATGEYGEAPMLAEMVASGDLPPVEERLPDEPLVVEVVDSIGVYGGTWRRWDDNVRIHAWEPLVKVDTDESLHPNLATGWEINDDLTEFVFTIRRGIKWSDGAPYTTEDIMFMWEDVYLNPEYPRFNEGGDGMDIEAIDDYTIRITFPDPQPTFLTRQSIQWGGLGFAFASYPKHYLSQFHPDYADADELQAMVAAEGMDTWDQLFDSKYWVDSNPEVPVITAWRVTTESSDATQRAVRNPYYWKVDAEGNQLPYIDYATWPQTADSELGILRAAAGEIDYTEEAFDTAAFPTLSDFADEGGYEVVRIESPFSPTLSALSVNQNYQGESEAMADLLRDLRFREALSLAIPRDEINEFVALGQSEPTAATVPANHPFGSEELTSYMIDFDLEEASARLDEIGITERDGEGFRLLSNGERLTLVLSPRRPLDVTVAEIIKPRFEEIGVRTNVSVEETSFWFQNKNAGLHMISMFVMQNGNPEFRDTWWVPINNNAYYAPMNGNWVASGGTEGVEPEGEIAELIEKYQVVRSSGVAAEREEALRWVIDTFTKNLWVIGTVTTPPRPIPVSNRMHNVPDVLYVASVRMPIWEYSQLYIDE